MAISALLLLHVFTYYNESYYEYITLVHSLK